MEENINKSIHKMDESMKKLDELMNTQLLDSKNAMKKNMIQMGVWSLLTLVVYFIWGATWYFWVGLTLSVLMIAAMVFGVIMLNKTNKILERADFDSWDENLECLEDESVEYTKTQKVLELLMNELEGIAESHGELYDTECREQMSEAIFNAFVFQEENYSVPSSLGFFSISGNKAVHAALNKYIIQMAMLLAEDSSEQERMDMFQDARVYSQSEQSVDDFFGWVDELVDIKPKEKIVS